MKKMRLNSVLNVILILLCGVVTISCNKSETIEAENLPEIVLDNSTGEYTVTVGNELTISPTYKNAAGAEYKWTSNGTVLAATPSLTKRWEDIGRFYVTITVTNKRGSASEELVVNVVEPAAPVISLPIPEDGLTLAVGSQTVITPEFTNKDISGFKVVWSINGAEAGSGESFTFNAESVGTYNITVTASNNEGSDSKSFIIKVVETLPIKLSFPTPSYFSTSTDRYTFPGRPVYLTPITGTATPGTYSWTVDGTDAGCDERTFVFTPETPGEYNISITADGSVTASVKVVCVNATEDDRYRASNGSSSAFSTKVFEWVPAPGQFINETSTGGMTGNENTPEAANSWAQGRLDNKSFVSLGGFGGYIIVGFDHSIKCGETGYDFSVISNAFFNSSTNEGGSNEPGIIYVMQDINGNGLPDDEWYELKGSETGKSETRQDYEVTYYRPAAPKMSVQWRDNYGNTGSVDHLPTMHTQDYYYPAWIGDDSYTLRGTCLKHRTTQNPITGLWDNSPFDWGYADNMGSDRVGNGDPTDPDANQNGLIIKNAMYQDFTQARLKYVDFIKIQTGVNSKAGILGEVSTEVSGVVDLHIER